MRVAHDRFAVLEARIDVEVRRALRDHAARIKHDLGKYVAFQARWLDEGADPEDLREALAADLLATRRGPEGSVDVLTVWAGFRAPLVGEALLEDTHHIDLSASEPFRTLDAAVSALAPAVDALRADEEIDLARTRAAALAVAEACKHFLDFARQEP